MGTTHLRPQKATGQGQACRCTSGWYTHAGLFGQTGTWACGLPTGANNNIAHHTGLLAPAICNVCDHHHGRTNNTAEGSQQKGKLADAPQSGALARAVAVVVLLLSMLYGFCARAIPQVCDFFMKTGHCRFGDSCVFDHPEKVRSRQCRPEG